MLNSIHPTQTLMSVPTAMVDATTTVETPLVVSTAHAGKDIALATLVLPVMVSLLVPTCYSVTIFCLADIDECEEGGNDCAQVCSNTMGSYTCGCNLGYQLATDQRSCLGECLFLVKGDCC